MLRALAFGDLAAGVWGAAWLPDAGESGFICLGAPDAVTVPSARLQGSDQDSDWQVLDDGTELTASAAADPVGIFDAGGACAGFEQLCRVHGRFALEGAEHAVDCLARRAVRTAPLDLGHLDSVRDVSAWFEPDDGLALVSLRPHRARGHDADLLTAAVLCPEGSGAAADPRFSTTYDSAGRPIRSSLELWLGEEEDEYPRRAAGQALGPWAAGNVGGLEVHARLFRWHSRGHEGAGVYLLAQRA